MNSLNVILLMALLLQPGTIWGDPLVSRNDKASISNWDLHVINELMENNGKGKQSKPLTASRFSEKVGEKDDRLPKSSQTDMLTQNSGSRKMQDEWLLQSQSTPPVPEKYYPSSPAVHQTAVKGSDKPDERQQALPADLTEIIQDLSVCGVDDRPILTQAEQSSQLTQFINAFYEPWKEAGMRTTKSEFLYPYRSPENGEPIGWAENLLPWDPKRWQSVVSNANTQSFPSLHTRAISVRLTTIRAAPTSSPRFGDPSEAGEGYPFDYMNDSTLPIGFPLLVLHKSTDGAWLFVESGLAAGWVRTEDTAWVSDDFCQRQMLQSLAAVLKDNTPLRQQTGIYMGTTHLGAILPIVSVPGRRISASLSDSEQSPGNASGRDTNSRRSANDNGEDLKKSQNNSAKENVSPRQALTSVIFQQEPLTVNIPYRNLSGNAIATTITLPAGSAAQVPVGLTSKNIADLARQLFGQPYAWGGMDAKRDCSLMLHDLLTPFGIWLPRNSVKQIHTWRFHSIKGLTGDEKERRIIAAGLPFATLIWRPGHIGLYVGQKNGRALMFHDFWGVKTNTNGIEGRALAGRIGLTTLRYGEEMPNAVSGAFLDAVEAFSTLKDFKN